MKNKVMAGALFGMCVGAVYSIGAYVVEAYRAAIINEHIKKIPDESHEKHPQYFNEGEA